MIKTYDISLPKMTLKLWFKQLTCKHFYKYCYLIIGNKKAYQCLYCGKQTLKKLNKKELETEYKWLKILK